MEILEEKIQLLGEKDVKVIQENETIGFALLEMINNRYKRLPVINENEDLVGMITSTDILMAIEQNQDEMFLKTKIIKFMTKNVVSIDHDQTLKDVINIMDSSGRSGIPITKDNDIIGFITHKDIILLNILWRKLPNPLITEEETVGIKIGANEIIDENDTIEKAIRKMNSSKGKQLLVQSMDKSEYLGIITIPRIMKTLLSLLIIKGENLLELSKRTIETIVKEPLLKKNTPVKVEEVRNWMNARGLDAVPIYEAQDKPVRLVTERDLFKFLVKNI